PLPSGEPDTDTDTVTDTGTDSGAVVGESQSRHVGGANNGPTPLAASTARQPQRPQAGRSRVNTPRSAGSPQTDRYGVVIQTFEPLRENPEKRIDVRVLEY